VEKAKEGSKGTILFVITEESGQPVDGLLNRATHNSFGSLGKLIANMNTEGAVVQGS
ncbi:hypothetical protein Tco_0961540, partial [Tanacetum coccineum]